MYNLKNKNYIYKLYCSYFKKKSATKGLGVTDQSTKMLNNRTATIILTQK